MNKFLNLNLKRTMIVAALIVLPVAHAATMSKADFKAEKNLITAQYKADKAGCSSLSANAKDICVEQVKAKEKVARAELTFAYTGKPGDQNKILVAKAETSYAVAKEKCDDLAAGNPKDVCVKEAKAVETKALADAKMGRQISAARSDASDSKRDADYKVAAEKCDALAGDSKANCMANAKANFGKN